MNMQRKVVLYIAMSLDGYIAGKQGNLSFLDIVAQDGEDYGYHEFIKTVDTVILGRKTYDKVLDMGYEFPHKDKVSYIITRTARPSEDNMHFYTGDIDQLVDQLRSKPGGSIFVDGGAEIVNRMMSTSLIDEYVISVIPVFLGDGIRLFADGRPGSQLVLEDFKAFEKSLVQLRYRDTRTMDTH